MPPRKKVFVSTEKPEEAPVVVFLKVAKEDTEQEAQEAPEPLQATTYSDILKQENQTSKRFDESAVLQLFEKLHHQTTYQNAACFWCCHGFQWRSCVVPVSYDVYSKMYAAEGHYCSPECALASIQQDVRLTDTQRWYRMSLLRSLYQPLYPANHDIQPAPDKRCLRLFGGTLDIEQYRSFVWNTEHATLLAMPPIRLYMPSMNTQATVRDVKKYVALTHETVDKASTHLRLKRTKPVNVNVPTLDMCMKRGEA